MKILTAYYSKTGNTKTIAEEIQKELNCDVEEIEYIKNPSGPLSYLKVLYESLRGVVPEIRSIEKNPSDYDLVVVGTPVWASTMANPVLSYLTENKAKFKNLAFFCTCGGSGFEKTLDNMEEVTGKKPLETLYLTKTDMDSYKDKVKSYAANLKNIQ